MVNTFPCDGINIGSTPIDRPNMPPSSNLVRTLPSQGEEVGSRPVGSTKICNGMQVRLKQADCKPALLGSKVQILPVAPNKPL